MAQKHFYITTTLPYVNADPHMGHALEFVQADIIARYRRLRGDRVFFNTGTDEHGLKIYENAQKEGRDVKEYVDAYAGRFRDLMQALSISEHNFIRTTDPHHVAAAQAFWRKCEEAGDIYKKHYQAKYCVGCEMEKTDSELEHGICPLHPNKEIQTIEEENYFFRFSAYEKTLLARYEEDPPFVVPEGRMNEIKSFVARGLQDFSISRRAEKMPWGIPVPGDAEHVMYVWFDALVNYISAIGWPKDEKAFGEWWPVVQIAGKDNLRQQAAMWQAMLLSAGLPYSDTILIHGFITSGGQKMSKTVGNVVNPFDVVERYGADALRYFLAREIPTFDDGDFTEERFAEAYNGNLANGVGNLASRVLKMASVHGVVLSDTERRAIHTEVSSGRGEAARYAELLDEYKISEACHELWRLAGDIDKDIQKRQPFAVVKIDPEKGKRIIRELLSGVYRVALMLAPVLPHASEKIVDAINVGGEMAGPLFPRIE